MPTVDSHRKLTHSLHLSVDVRVACQLNVDAGEEVLTVASQVIHFSLDRRLDLIIVVTTGPRKLGDPTVDASRVFTFGSFGIK